MEFLLWREAWHRSSVRKLNQMQFMSDTAAICEVVVAA